MKKPLGPVAGLLALASVGLVVGLAHALAGGRPLKRKVSVERMRSLFLRHITAPELERLVSAAMSLPDEERTPLKLEAIAVEQLRPEQVEAIKHDPELLPMLQEYFQK